MKNPSRAASVIRPLASHPYTLVFLRLVRAVRFTCRRVSYIIKCMTTRLETAHAQFAQGDFAAAAATAKGLVQLGQQLDQAYTMLGMASFRQGQLPAARQAFGNLTSRYPQQPHGWTNLFLTALELRDNALAETCLRKLMALQSDNPQHATLLAGLLLQSGRAGEFRHLLDDVRRRFPAYGDAAYLDFEGQVQFAPPAAWLAAAQKLQGISLTPVQTALVWLALNLQGWLERLPMAERGMRLTELAMSVGQLKALAGAETPQAQKQNHVNGRLAEGYLGMLRRLLPLEAPAPDASLPRVYLLGDSHVLPPHGQTVTVDGVAHQLEAQLVVGSKLWFLAKPADNMRRAALAAKLAALPAGAVCVVSLGEIDLRPDEGIWPLYKKGRGHWRELVASTIPPALAWLAAQAGGRRLMITGTPTPSAIQLAKVEEAQRGEYQEFVVAANAALADAARAHGFGFIDIHAFTAGRPAGYLDEVHLLPCVLPEALTQALGGENPENGPLF